MKRNDLAGRSSVFLLSRCTGKERDTESGNDYFGARYFGSSMGRFLSPDPLGIVYADITNPQSFNLYSYVYNNPLINIDPSGMECVWDDGSYDAADDPDTGSSDKCGAVGGTWEDPTWFENMEGTQYGDWSGNASSQIAFDMLTPSVETDSGPSADVGTSDGPDFGLDAGGNAYSLNFSLPSFSIPGNCASEPLHIPLVVTSPYGPRSGGFHPGVDYRAPIGTPVYSAESGTVARAYSSSSAGNVVVVQNPFGGDSIYMHLSGFGVSSGQSVGAGSRLGTSGNTGNSTGPHLHFEQHTPGPIYDASGHFNHATRTAPCR